MGGPTSSYAAAGIALEFIGAHKPPHPATTISSRGVTHNIVLANLTIWAQVFCKCVPTLIALLQPMSSHENKFLVLTVRKSVWDVTVFILR
jgi:hypothetical protein